MIKKAKLCTRSLMDIPCEVIWQILCMLPIKSCLTCKLVCKVWYGIITSSRFAALRRFYCPDRMTLLLHGYFSNGRKNFMLVELDKDSDNVDVTGDLVFGTDSVIRFKSKFDEPHYKFRIGNVCNGLVCVRSGDHWGRGSYYICNLLTSQYVRVEQPGYESGMVPGFGLGYCDATQQYKIIRFIEVQTMKEYAVEIQTVGTRKWRRVQGVPKSRYHDGPFLNGSLHWYCDKSKCLWAFHFATERFYCVPTPDAFSEPGYMLDWKEEYDLTAFESCLCFCCFSIDYDKSEVWVMKEYGVKESWVKLFTTNRSEVYVPLMRMNGGQMLIRSASGLAFYNPVTWANKNVGIDEISACNVLACDVDFSRMLSAPPPAETKIKKVAKRKGKAKTAEKSEDPVEAKIRKYNQWQAELREARIKMMEGMLRILFPDGAA